MASAAFLLQPSPSTFAPASSEFKPLTITTPVPFSAPDMPQMEIGDDDLPF